MVHYGKVESLCVQDHVEISQRYESRFQKSSHFVEDVIQYSHVMIEKDSGKLHTYFATNCTLFVTLPSLMILLYF